LLLGFWSEELVLARPSLMRALVLPIVLVVFPSLIEEFIYRGLLLPRSLADASSTRRFWAVTGSTAVYVAAHPIVPLIGLVDSDFFLSPWMLIVVAILGYTLGYSYIRSWSLWAPIVIHWATVVVWNLFLKVQP
jgi:membrane protease YdiL (CAAX protease family)